MNIQNKERINCRTCSRAIYPGHGLQEVIKSKYIDYFLHLQDIKEYPIMQFCSKKCKIKYKIPRILTRPPMSRYIRRAAQISKFIPKFEILKICSKHGAALANALNIRLVNALGENTHILTQRGPETYEWYIPLCFNHKYNLLLSLSYDNLLIWDLKNIYNRKSGECKAIIELEISNIGDHSSWCLACDELHDVIAYGNMWCWGTVIYITDINYNTNTVIQTQEFSYNLNFEDLHQLKFTAIGNLIIYAGYFSIYQRNSETGYYEICTSYSGIPFPLSTSCLELSWCLGEGHKLKIMDTEVKEQYFPFTINLDETDKYTEFDLIPPLYSLWKKKECELYEQILMVDKKNEENELYRICIYNIINGELVEKELEAIWNLGISDYHDILPIRMIYKGIGLFLIKNKLCIRDIYNGRNYFKSTHKYCRYKNNICSIKY